MFSSKCVWTFRRASYKMVVYIASSSRISCKKHIKEQCQNVRAYDDIVVQDMSREVRVNCGKKKITTLLTELLQLGLMDEHFIIHSAAPNRKRRRVTLEMYFFSSRLLRLRSCDIIGFILLFFAYRTLPRSLIPLPSPLF
jgi:hypothetical protein